MWVFHETDSNLALYVVIFFQCWFFSSFCFMKERKKLGLGEEETQIKGGLEGGRSFLMLCVL